MTDFCQQTNLNRSAQSWPTTTLLATVVYVIPLMLLRIAGAFHLLDGRALHWRFSVELAALMMIIMAVPLFHFFISSSRMKHESLGLRPRRRP